jgi:hypothetical protein
MQAKRGKNHMRLNDQGFILPLSVMLVLMLTVSGTSFMHHDYLERVMAMQAVDHKGAFYLANGGIERARETLKFELVDGEPDWTQVLTDPALADPVALANPAAAFCPLCLCGNDPTRGCIVPTFQTISAGAVDPVTSPNLPFIAGQFEAGLYDVRAFNNPGDPGTGTEDTDGKLTIRALGAIRGQQKLLEATAAAASGVKLINCECNPDATCPESVNGRPDVEPMEGKEPACTPMLPYLDPALDEADNFYRDPANFSWVTNPPVDLTGMGDVTLTPTPDPAVPSQVLLQDNTYYYATGKVTLQNTGTNTGVVIFSDLFDAAQDLTGINISTNVTLNGSILIARETITMNGGITISAPSPNYPAIISDASVHGDAVVEIFGGIFARDVDLGPMTVHGVLIGEDVEIQGGNPNACNQPGGTCYTDDGNTDYYQFWEGFEYPDELKTTKLVAGGWRELQ